MEPNVINLVTKRVLVYDQLLANYHIYRRLSRISLCKDLFDNVAARNIINFIKESHFYSTV